MTEKKIMMHVATEEGTDVVLPATRSTIVVHNDTTVAAKLDEHQKTIGGLTSKMKIEKGRLITDFSKFVLWYGTVAQDTAYNLVGASSVKITADATNTTAAARLRQTKFNITKTNTLLIRFYVEDVDKLSNIELRVASTDNMTEYLFWRATKWKVITGWNEMLISVQDMSWFGPTVDEPDKSNINTIQISVTCANNETTSVWFDAIYMYHKSKGKVVFHFDDSYSTVHTNAFPIMRAVGMVGCAGVISGSVGTTGYMTLSQLKELQAYGWDIFNHTHTHQDLSTLTEEQVRVELNTCRTWLINNGFPEAAEYVAYPYGGYNETVRKAMEGYKAGRLVREEYEVVPPIQPIRQKTINMYNTLTLDNAKRIIDYVEKTGATVILLFHKIEPATNTENLNYSLDKFEPFVNYVYSKMDTVDVISWAEMMAIQ